MLGATIGEESAIPHSAASPQDFSASASAHPCDRIRFSVLVLRVPTGLTLGAAMVKPCSLILVIQDHDRELRHVQHSGSCR